MTKIFEKYLTILFISVPFFLITGPAIPDLIITLSICISLYILFLKDKFFYKNNTLINISFFFWCTLILISFFSFDKKSSFQDSLIFIRFLLIPICMYFLIFKNNKDIKSLVTIIFCLVILVSLDTLYQFFNYNSKDGFGSDILGFKSQWYGRLTGPFGDELIPGSYLSKFGLIGYVFLLFNKKFKRNILAQSIYLSAILLVTFASGERMALATYSLALFVLLLFFRGNRKAIFLSILIGVVLIILTYKFHPFYNDYAVIESTEYHQGLKIEKEYNCLDDENKVCKKIINIQPSFIKILQNFKTSAYGEIYLLSIRMFKDNIITGIGISNFEYLCKKEKKYKNMMNNYQCASHPHNIYIQWLSEGGLIVFISFCLYLLSLIYIIYNNSGERKYKLISFVVLLIMFWPIMSTGSLIKNWYGILSFFIVGICMCLSKFKNNY